MKKKIDFTRPNAFVKRGVLFNIASYMFHFLIVVPVLFIIKVFVLRLRVRGKRNLKSVIKGGAVIIANHVHYFDVPMIGLLINPRRIYSVSLESNFYLPVAGSLMRLLKAVPVPKDIHYMKQFMAEMQKLLAEGKKVVIMPEGHLIVRYPGIREFKTGAFRMAMDAGAPILPAVYTYKGKKMTLNFLEPMRALEGESAVEYMNRAHEVMSKFFTEHTVITQVEKVPEVEPISEEAEQTATSQV